MSPPSTNEPEKQSNHPPELPERPWFERLNLLNATLLIFLLLVISSGLRIDGSERDLNVWLNLFSPRFLSSGPLRAETAALLETVEIALVDLFCHSLLARHWALPPGPSLQSTHPHAAQLIRTIPSLIWAVIAVAAMGANAAAGVAALTLYSIGYLGKFFSEAFESVDISIARSLRGIGADPVQAFQYGIWPHAKPLVWSHGIWMLEYNIRSASIIGYVGAGGLGLQLHAYQEFHQWDRFATVLLCILVVVTLLDFLSERIRRRIARRQAKESAV